MSDHRNRKSETDWRSAQDGFSRICNELEQAILDAELEFLQGRTAEEQQTLAAALPTVHAGLLLRYLATLVPPGVDVRAIAVAAIDATLRENGEEIFEIAREAKRKPH